MPEVVLVGWLRAGGSTGTHRAHPHVWNHRDAGGAETATTGVGCGGGRPSFLISPIVAVRDQWPDPRSERRLFVFTLVFVAHSASDTGLRLLSTDARRAEPTRRADAHGTWHHVFMILLTFQLSQVLRAHAELAKTCLRGEPVPFRRNYTSFVHAMIGALRHAPLSSHRGHGVPPLHAGLACAFVDRGYWMEFGVYKALTITSIAGYRSKKLAAAANAGVFPASFEGYQALRVLGFDSFRGLPEDWRDVWRKTEDGKAVRVAAKQSRGLFSLGGKPPALPADLQHAIKWEIGWYNETLPRFLEAHPSGNVTFVHVDCDLYSSTKTVLDQLAPRLQVGTVLVFDELFNYPEYRWHELLALWEFLRDNKRFAMRPLAVSTHEIELSPRVENKKEGQSCAFLLVAASSP